MAKLVLVRHGESIWNAKGFWTGWTNVPLDEHGMFEARKTAKLLKDIPFDYAFTSALLRAQETLNQIKLELHYQDLPTTETEILNERNYGDLTGKNKWDIKDKYGEEQFNKWRRGWDEPIPNGETLKDVYARVIPYYEEHIETLLKDGDNVLVVSHGNTMRALMKYLQDIPVADVPTLEIGIAEAVIYDVNEKGEITNHEIRGGARDIPHEKD